VTASKYARVEYERRFLLAGVPAGAVLRTVDIDDRYLDGTWLRLRRQAERGRPVICKLTQKLPRPGEYGEITTLYISADEHAALAGLPAATLRKTRLSIAPYGVDVFAAPFEGLVLAEAEFESRRDAEEFSPAAFCHAEVTRDARFTGGSLARAAREDVAAWASEYGVELRAGATP
jgi:CYTH domain-containing protein